MEYFNILPVFSQGTIPDDEIEFLYPILSNLIQNFNCRVYKPIILNAIIQADSKKLIECFNNHNLNEYIDYGLYIPEHSEFQDKDFFFSKTDSTLKNKLTKFFNYVNSDKFDIIYFSGHTVKDKFNNLMNLSVLINSTEFQKSFGFNNYDIPENDFNNINFTEKELNQFKFQNKKILIIDSCSSENIFNNFNECNIECIVGNTKIIKFSNSEEKFISGKLLIDKLNLNNIEHINFNNNKINIGDFFNLEDIAVFNNQLTILDLKKMYFDLIDKINLIKKENISSNNLFELYIIIKSIVIFNSNQIQNSYLTNCKNEIENNKVIILNLFNKNNFKDISDFINAIIYNKNLRFADCFECGGKCCKFWGFPFQYKDVIYTVGVPIEIYKSFWESEPEKYFSMRDGMTIKDNQIIVSENIDHAVIDSKRFGKTVIVYSKCLKLNDEGKCSIYDERPSLCRKFVASTAHLFNVPKGCIFEYGEIGEEFGV